MYLPLLTPVLMHPLLSALVVDDEEKAVALMKKLLEDTQQFYEIRTAQSASAAGHELGSFTPDFIFLDIKMPGQNGFSLLKNLHQQNTRSEIVFVTAYDEFALDAIRNHAFGYLLKPVNRTELQECINYYKSFRARPDVSEKINKLLGILENKPRFRIDTRTGYYFIDPHSILFCEADGNYSTLSLGDKKHFCTLQLGMIETLLPGSNFVRAGRSLIVNYHRIANVDRKMLLVNFEKDSRIYPLKVSKLQLKELEKGIPHEAFFK